MAKQKLIPNTERVNLGRLERTVPLPNLIEAQQMSYDWLVGNGLKELFEEISPIEDATGSLWSLSFKDHRVDKPTRTPYEAKRKGLSYDIPLYVKTELTNKKTGEIKEQELFVTDFPMMTEHGTFIVNGNERVIIHQIIRSEGAIILDNPKVKAAGLYYMAKLMPERGPWVDIEINKHNVLSVKLVERRPKVNFATLLRALGYSSDKQIIDIFKDVDTNPNRKYLESTIEKDPTRNTEEAIINVYQKLRPDDAVTLKTAKAYIENFLFNPRNFYLGKTGRYQINRKFHNSDKEPTEEDLTITTDDIITIVKQLLQVNNEEILAHDIDHLSNRRLRGNGELLANRLRIGMRRMEKNIRDKMSAFGTDELITPSVLISTRPITAAIQEFFGSSAVSRYMDQDNILAEVENKRKLTAGGPGGLTKERATFSVRDAHISQYSKLCPVTTPEGPQIGLVNQLAMYARINSYGLIEAPYYVLKHTASKKSELVNRILNEDAGGAKKGTIVDEKLAAKLEKEGKEVKVYPFVTGEMIYVDAHRETSMKITNITDNKDEFGNITKETLSIRYENKFLQKPKEEVELIDVDPSQIAALGFSLISFAPNDDPTRALMGSNMQRQAVPLIKPQSPIVGTGMEETIARQSGHAVYAAEKGEVTFVDASTIKVKGKSGEKEFGLIKYQGTNQNTSVNQRPVVKVGQKVKEGELLADGPSMQHGELALGTNLVVAYKFHDGYNFEDAVVVSERLAKEDVMTSVHIKEYTQDIRETKLGPEQITRDIPNVGETALRNLDEKGIVRIGAHVGSGDILSGIIAPKGETELSAEERLLRAIFGEFARDIRDNSLRLPHGEKGIVVDVQVLNKDKGDKLGPGVLKQVRVWVAKIHKIGVGDKIAGRHGDKGVISKVLPVEDMPYLEDGTPVDMILTPLFIKRMNMGQLQETHVGLKANALGKKVAVPIFNQIDETIIDEELEEKGITGEFLKQKQTLYDGRTGEQFDAVVTVGPRYILKLNHLADSKVHARSTGSYTMVTQQPLGGKSQMGGQRFGEMEVWALEAHGVPHVLQEMLTIKSDDVMGRANAYKAIINGTKIEAPTIPESFKVLISELKSLGLNLETIMVHDENTVTEVEEEESSEGEEEHVHEDHISDKDSDAKTEEAPEKEAEAEESKQNNN